MLENLFIIQHGVEEVNGNLSSLGTSQMEELTCYIFKQIGLWDEASLILGSPSPNAEESAKFLANAENFIQNN